MMDKATLSLVVAKTGDNELTVSITPKGEGCNIVPGTIVGSPQELDEKFADAISGLVQDTEAFILKNKAAKDSMKKEDKKPAAGAKTTVKKEEPKQASLPMEEKKPDVKPEPKEEPKAETPAPVQETKAPETAKPAAQPTLEFSFDVF